MSNSTGRMPGIGGSRRGVAPASAHRCEASATLGRAEGSPPDTWRWGGPGVGRGYPLCESPEPAFPVKQMNQNPSRQHIESERSHPVGPLGVWGWPAAASPVSSPGARCRQKVSTGDCQDLLRLGIRPSPCGRRSPPARDFATKSSTVVVVAGRQSKFKDWSDREEWRGLD
jgi:hypothetical protein